MFNYTFETEKLMKTNYQFIKLHYYNPILIEVMVWKFSLCQFCEEGKIFKKTVNISFGLETIFKALKSIISNFTQSIVVLITTFDVDCLMVKTAPKTQRSF